MKIKILFILLLSSALISNKSIRIHNKTISSNQKIGIKFKEHQDGKTFSGISFEHHNNNLNITILNASETKIIYSGPIKKEILFKSHGFIVKPQKNNMPIKHDFLKIKPIYK